MNIIWKGAKCLPSHAVHARPTIWTVTQPNSGALPPPLLPPPQQEQQPWRRRRSRSRNNRGSSIRGSVEPTCRINTMQLFLVEPAVVLVAVLPVPLLHHQPILECQLALRRRAVGHGAIWLSLSNIAPWDGSNAGWEGLWVGSRAESIQKVRFVRTCSHIRRSVGGRKVQGEHSAKAIWQASFAVRVCMPVVARGGGESLCREQALIHHR